MFDAVKDINELVLTRADITRLGAFVVKQGYAGEENHEEHRPKGHGSPQKLQLQVGTPEHEH